MGPFLLPEGIFDCAVIRMLDSKDVIHALRASFDGFILAHLLGFAKGFEFGRTSRMGVWHAWHSTPLPYGPLSKLRLGALRNSFGARATDFLATRHTNYKCMEVFSNP